MLQLGHNGTEDDQAWYVKKVEIDIPSKDKHFEFTLDCWISQDKGEVTKLFVVDGFVPGPVPQPKKSMWLLYLLLAWPFQ